ncbi:MAG: putative porin [Paramuribaculum sp.]|nr:putative porin [Paramuribaculum sp.]
MRHLLKILILSLVVVAAVGSAGAKKREVAPSYAWTMLEPLGLREPATIDTTLFDYAQRSVACRQSMMEATTGTLGAPALDMVAMSRMPVSDFFFRDALRPWIPPMGTHKFYNTRIPMTLLSYNTGGSRDNNQDRLSATFSGNVDRSIQIGAMLDYIYSKGCYDNQAAKNLIWGLSGSYITDRYEMQAFFNHFNSVNKENGGITDDLYITDPAQLQGGNSSISPKSIPTRLTNAHSRVVGTQFVVNNRYNLGFYRDLPRPDSIPYDTVERRKFVPVTSFCWTLSYVKGRHVFDNKNTSEASREFWANTYLDNEHTHDNTSYYSVSNTLGVSLLEGFNKYAKAGLSAFITHEFLRYNQTADSIPIDPAERPDELTPWPLDAKLAPHSTENRLYAGAQLTKQSGTWVRYAATGRIGLIGPTVGDLDIKGEASLRVPLLRDTLAVTGYGAFSNTEVPYFLKSYLSNHFVWKNDFGKTRRLRFGGRLDFGRSDTHLDIGVENIQNLVWFDSDAMPAQHGGSIQVFWASLVQNFKVGILHWNNRVVYQTTTNDVVMPLPKLGVYSNLFINFRVAKVLEVQLGIDGNYHTRYYAPDYQPATMSFYSQREIMVGNYVNLNAYANLRLGRARFYVMMSHVNQGLFGNDYFSMPHYPLNPRMFQMGVSVDFAN